MTAVNEAPPQLDSSESLGTRGLPGPLEAMGTVLGPAFPSAGPGV